MDVAFGIEILLDFRPSLHVPVTDIEGHLPVARKIASV